MSQTAQELIKASLRAINAIATGETPTAAEMADGLEALKIMLRSWSSSNILIYSISQDTLAMTGASSYTIGSGGDADTTWPVEIKGAVVDTDYNLRMIGEARYRALSMSNLGSTAGYLWYNPVYPLGVLYPYPTGGSSMVIDSLKALTDPASLTTDVVFHPSYDAAIKWNLALQLAPEYGKQPSPLIFKFAEDSKRVIETKNTANQINAVDLSAIGRGGGNYDIDGDT
jgi:hypothetical protein